MTPKEKAEELILKFKQLPQEDSLMFYLSFELSKQCALITAEEIIKQNVSTSTDYGASWTYWMQVKEEIKELKANK